MLNGTAEFKYKHLLMLKFSLHFHFFNIIKAIQIQHLLMLNNLMSLVFQYARAIQIQHLLMLNICRFHLYRKR